MLIGEGNRAACDYPVGIWRRKVSAERIQRVYVGAHGNLCIEGRHGEGNCRIMWMIAGSRASCN